MVRTKSQSGTQNKSQLLKEFHGIQDQYRKIIEDAKYVRTFRGQPILKQYLDGTVSFILDVPIAKRQIIKTRSRTRHYPEIPIYSLAFVVFYDNALDGSYFKQWNQQQMFVRNVKFVKGADGIIPSSVWANFGHNQVVQFGASGIYFSAFKNTFKTLPAVVERKLGMTVRRNRSVRDNDCNPSIIQSGPQVVESVTNNQGQSGSELLKVADRIFSLLCSSILISLDCDGVSVWHRANDGIEISDVLIGPLNFQTGFMESSHTSHFTTLG